MELGVLGTKRLQSQHQQPLLKLQVCVVAKPGSFALQSAGILVLVPGTLVASPGHYW
jgi:hypothetical protein